MARAKKSPKRFTSFGTRKTAVDKLSAANQTVANLNEEIASYDKQLALMPNDTIINYAAKLDLMRLRAIAQKKLNSIGKKCELLSERIETYNSNDEEVLRSRKLYWGK